jgi:hypothetical protein
MKHPFTDDELIIIFEIAGVQLYRHFDEIADATEYEDKGLSDLLNKLHKYMAGEVS